MLPPTPHSRRGMGKGLRRQLGTSGPGRDQPPTPRGSRRPARPPQRAAAPHHEVAGEVVLPIVVRVLHGLDSLNEFPQDLLLAHPAPPAALRSGSLSLSPAARPLSASSPPGRRTSRHPAASPALRCPALPRLSHPRACPRPAGAARLGSPPRSRPLGRPLHPLLPPSLRPTLPGRRRHRLHRDTTKAPPPLAAQARCPLRRRLLSPPLLRSRPAPGSRPLALLRPPRSIGGGAR